MASLIRKVVPLYSAEQAETAIDTVIRNRASAANSTRNGDLSKALGALERVRKSTEDPVVRQKAGYLLALYETRALFARIGRLS
jgi:hypothetical protein